MKKVAIVGVEGSGKTVMMAAMGEQWERPDERGYFLSPENAEAFGFSKSVMAILRSGRWPNASSHDEMRTLAWSLQRRQGGSLEKIADISMLDYAGEVYRQAFGGEKREGYDEQVATLRSHVDEADVLIVFVNLSDIINGSMSNWRTRDAMWLTKGVLDCALGDKPRKPHAAIVFTLADSYREIISANGGTAATLKNYLPHVANLYGDLPIFTASAIDRTVIGGDGLPIPAPDFQSTGLCELMDWMIRIGEVDKLEERRMESDYGDSEPVRENEHIEAERTLITESAPLVHLDVKGHKLQKKSRFWGKVIQFILCAPIVAALVAGVVYRDEWEYRYGDIIRDVKKLNDQMTDVENVMLLRQDLEAMGWSPSYNLPADGCEMAASTNMSKRILAYHKNGADHRYSWRRCGMKANDSGNVDLREVRLCVRRCYEDDLYFRSWLFFGMSPLPLILLIIIRRIMGNRTRKVLVFFRGGKWTKAMDKRYFLFPKDAFMRYYHAVCYLFGFGGVAVDYAKAGRLFLLSAKRGVAESLVGLGWMAEKGMGMPQSVERAKQYYDEARSMGAGHVPEAGA